jgi:putative ATP-dependent endonuclease of the OLD family
LRVRHIEIRNFRGIKSLSWHVKGDICCIIGPGDTCKTTILTALDYALSPRTSLSFEDSDFFNQDVDQDIVIQVTLTDWDETQTGIRKFFQESKFAQYKCGLDDTRPLAEPREGGTVAVSVSLRVDGSLEPKWFVVKGRDEGEATERKPLYAADRDALGLSRLDTYSDYHFTWGRNTLLTRLSADNEGNLGSVLSGLAREMRQGDISGHESIAECQGVADAVKQESSDAGVKLTELSPKIDIQRQSMTAGALSLHENNVPLRNKGSGTKRLVAAAMQMKLHGGKNISLIDEIEVGLEPHRIRGLIYRLQNTGQQIVTTTHSPVVIREFNVTKDELYVCRRDPAGTVSLESLAVVPDIQGPVRNNAEAFLGSKIIACEGLTEIGCLRAYDQYRFKGGSTPVWSLATSYFNARSGGQIKVVCPKLHALGYRTAAFCDNDAQDQLSDAEVAQLRATGIHVCQWEANNSTERQLFHDLPWSHIPDLLTTIADSHRTLDRATIIDCVIKDARLVAQTLGTDSAAWLERPLLRQVMGELAHERGWIKSIGSAANVFYFALPLLPGTSVIKSRLGLLWDWVQDE